MIEDHRGVVSGEGAPTVRAERLAELLDGEILPCLERPSRLLGPFDGSFPAADGSPDVAWVWPSLAEGSDTPRALRPALSHLPVPPEVRIGLACAPAPDVERALQSHAIPWFARPALVPLVDVPVWVVWLDSPLQLLGLLSVFVASGVEPRAARRGGSMPRVIVSGPAATRVPDLAAVYGDLVVAPAVDGALARALAGLRAGTPPVDGEGITVGGREAPDGPVLERAGHAAAATGRRAAPAPAWSVRSASEGLQDVAPVRLEGRGDAYTLRVFTGSASAALRERLGLVSSTRLQKTIDAVLAEDAGEIEFDFLLGLPDESIADRAAIARLIADAVAAAPRGARQVRARIGAFLPEDPAHAIRPAALDAALTYLQDNLPTRRTRIDAVPAALPAIECTLRATGAAAAPVLEAIHAAGGRRADCPEAIDAALWAQSLRARALPDTAFDDPPGGVEAYTGVASPTGYAPVLRPVPTPAPANRRGRKRSRRKTTRPDRWARWMDLVPRQFDHRIEFAKEGRLRFVGANEITEMFLRACARAQVPLATSGVAQPRPKISFGPSLATGVEGCAEVVDLGLELLVPDLLERLRPHLPDGLRLNRMLRVPTHAPDTALSRVALTEYEATLSADLWDDARSRAKSRERIASWHRRLLEGASCADATDDEINQIHAIDLTGDPDGLERLQFTLDLRGPGSKLRPREVLERGLAEVKVDVRRIPLRRLRLLMIEDDTGRRRHVTPIEQALRVERRLRARAKLSA